MSDDKKEDTRAEQVKELARRHAELAIGTLAEVAGNPDAKSAARVMASKVLLERGFGMPDRRIEQTHDVHIFDQRQAHLSALQALAARTPLITVQPKVAKVEDADWSDAKDAKARTKRGMER